MRICIWAAAGAGKSTVAPGLMHEFKKKGWNVESVQEYIKKWAYEGRVPKSYDQVYIFGKQLHAEDSLLQTGVEHLITDSPVLMQPFYARKFGFKCWESLLEIGQAFDAEYPSFNIFLDREGIPYQQKGRYEDEATAKANDLEMRQYMDEFVGDYTVLKSVDLESMVGALEFLAGE